jgi:hypothetical protein
MLLFMTRGPAAPAVPVFREGMIRAHACGVRVLTKSPSRSAAKHLGAQSCLWKSPGAAALLGWLAASVFAEAPAAAQDATQGIAGNPGAVDVEPGTGDLGRLIGFGPDSGVRLGGVLVSNGNYLASGGNSPGVASFNNLFVTGLNADLDKLVNIPGAMVGAALLRFDGQPTNQQAGLVTGSTACRERRHSIAPNFMNSGGANRCSRTHLSCGSESWFRLTISAMSYVQSRYKTLRSKFLRSADCSTRQSS